MSRIVPFVDGRGHVQAFVALETNEPTPKGIGQNLGDLGLADTGLALEEQGPPQGQRKVQRRRQAAICDVLSRIQQRNGRIDRAGEGRIVSHARSLSNSPKAATGQLAGPRF